MQIKVQRWGNSLALRLPKAAAIKAGVSEGSSLDLEASAGRLVARAVHRYRLADLLVAVTSKNVHDEVFAGPAVGREAL